MIKKAKIVLVILALILIVSLLISNAYFIYQSQKSDYQILIGIPAAGTEQEEAINFTESDWIKDKKSVETLLFSMLMSDTLSEEETAAAPDAVMFIGTPGNRMGYFKIFLWLEEDAVVYQRDSTSQRKQIPEQFSEELRKIVEHQISPRPTTK